MAKIKYIEHNGKEHIVDVSKWSNCYGGALFKTISPGIDADCGGGMSCATCHVYVKEDWYDKLPKKEIGEDDMLDQAYEPNSSSSRLVVKL